jgi:5-methylthioadenosine/S-adenosylhomocysteine deaminase
MTAKLAPTLESHYILKNACIIVSSSNWHEKADIEIKDGVIVCISEESKKLASASGSIKTYDASSYVLYPGLINAHTHAAMSFFRDLGHGKPEMIENFLMPAEESLTAELLEPLAYSYLVDALRSGTTLVADHYYLVEGVGKAAERLGMRAALGETIADLGGAFPQTSTFEHARKAIESWNFSDKITPVLAPHASDTVSDEQAKKIVNYAKAQQLPVHMHLSQTSGEYLRTSKRTNKSPVKWANDIGLLTESTLAVHLVTLKGGDFQLLNDSGATGVICPASQIIYENLANISKIKASGTPLCIATDCAASNDSAKIISEAKFAALLDKHQGSPKIDHPYWFRSITENPAKALGLSAKIGTLEPGKKADIVFRRKSIDTEPIRDPWVNFLFSSAEANVDHVMIDGSFSLYERQLTNASEETLNTDYRRAVTEISKRAGLS